MLISAWISVLIALIITINIAVSVEKLCTTDADATIRSMWLVWLAMNAAVFVHMLGRL